MSVKVMPIKLGKWGSILCLCFIGSATQLNAEEPVRFGSFYFPPFVENVGSPGYEGIAIEKVRAIYKVMGKDVEVTILPWKRAQFMAERGELHGVFPCGLFKKWEDKYALSKPVFIEHLVLVAGKGKYSGIRSLEELQKPQFLSATVGVARGYVIIKELEQAKVPTIIIVPADTNGLRMIKHDRIQFIYTGEIGITDLVRKVPGYSIEDFDLFRIRKFPMGVCFPRAAVGWKRRVKEFNAALENLGQREPQSEKKQ